MRQLPCNDGLAVMELLPIFLFAECGEKDERFDGVILLWDGDEEKTTAEDCGEYWHIREWEIFTSATEDGKRYWFCRSGNSLSKDIVRKLATANVELTGAARPYRAASSDRRERG
jgi:hypothetical protein